LNPDRTRLKRTRIQHQTKQKQINMQLEHSTPELFAALAKMQGEVENATKGSVNPHFKSRYADLAEVLNTVRPVMSANGLSVIQSPAFDGVRVGVTTTICHSSGGYVSGEISCVPAKHDGQGVGAATTYLRRYALAAFAGVAQEDDDGQSATTTQRVAYPKITPDGVAFIKSELEELAIDEAAFLKHYGVTTIAEITTDKVALIDWAFSAKRKPKTTPESLNATFEAIAKNIKTN
jgi:hypothetical protein